MRHRDTLRRDTLPRWRKQGEAASKSAPPHLHTLRVWLRDKPEFTAQYARAREEQADFHADEIIEIANTTDDPQKEVVRSVRARAREGFPDNSDTQKKGRGRFMQHGARVRARDAGAGPDET